MVKSVSSIKLNKTLSHQLKPRYSFVRDLINSSGILTKEDCMHVQQIKSKYSKFSIEEINEELSKSFKNLTKYVQSCLKDTKLIANVLIYNTNQTLPKSLIKKLKSYKLFQFSLLNLKYNKTNRNIILAPTDISYDLSENTVKNLPVSTKESLLIHPVEIASHITGYQDNPSNNKTELYQSNARSLLIKEQEQVLNKISYIIENKGAEENFVYTDNDIKKLKQLIKKYHILNSVLRLKGININNVETLFFSSFLATKHKYR